MLFLHNNRYLFLTGLLTDLIYLPSLLKISYIFFIFHEIFQAEKVSWNFTTIDWHAFTFVWSPAPVVIISRLTLLVNVQTITMAKNSMYTAHLTIRTGPSKHWAATMPLSRDTVINTSHASVFICLQKKQHLFMQSLQSNHFHSTQNYTPRHYFTYVYAKSTMQTYRPKDTREKPYKHINIQYVEK